MNKQICTHCGYIGESKKIAKGSILIELALWILFFPVGILYSIWRLISKESVCPMCKNPGMIPVDSPLGKKLSA